jgi:hypothetical protein
MPGGYTHEMRYLSAPALALLTTTASFAQITPSNQESGDIYADAVRVNNELGNGALLSPFNMGFVDTTTSPIMYGTFSADNVGTPSSPLYYPGVYIGYEYVEEVQSVSAIGINFTPTSSVSSPFTIPVHSLVMNAYDYIPCIETKLPKGSYTFQATATPLNGTSTPGSFVFATQTAGVWTTQFALALPKAEGATRTLTFAHDTRVRWMLVNQTGETATAAITARYYNSGS